MPLVRSFVDGPTMVIALNRPEQRNAVSSAMLEELLAAFGDLAADPACRVVVVRGAGPDFCAGADIDELERARTDDSAVAYGRALEEVLRTITTHPVPVIAEVQGAALGAGCQLALACDLVVAATNARLGIPSARLGVVINYESVERLVLAVGPKRAGELLYTGRTISGDESVAWGLANAAVEPGALSARTQRLAVAVSGAAPLSVRGSKGGISSVLGALSIDRSAREDRVADFDTMAAQAMASEDLAEGLLAFRERRQPEFRGR
jgi:enoyl-CoA hydratase/carnithine racemase